LTVATGTSDTVTATVALLPSLVAVIVAAPTPAAVTRPAPSTVATPDASLPQLTPRADNGFPAASRGVAVSCPVRPILRSRWSGVPARGESDRQHDWNAGEARNRFVAHGDERVVQEADPCPAHDG